MALEDNIWKGEVEFEIFREGDKTFYRTSDGKVGEVSDWTRAEQKYRITRRENHGFGYHFHVEVLKRGKYVRTGHIITYKDGKFYIKKHGRSGKALVDYLKVSSAILGDIKSELEARYQGISNSDYLSPGRDSLELFELDKDKEEEKELEKELEGQ